MSAPKYRRTRYDAKLPKGWRFLRVGEKVRRWDQFRWANGEWAFTAAPGLVVGSSRVKRYRRKAR